MASGRASVVKSKSLGERATEDGVADAPADQVQAVAGGREPLGQGRRLVEKRLQPLGDHGDNDGTGPGPGRRWDWLGRAVCVGLTCGNCTLAAAWLGAGCRRSRRVSAIEPCVRVR